MFDPPARVRPDVFARLPSHFRKPISSEWADANKAGQPVDCFLEGPSFDPEGRLYVTDIPHGRVFRISPAGEWSLIAEYDGWPNGLKIDGQGRIIITDYRHGLMRLDPDSGAVTPLITHHRSESFKGVNDLAIAANGDIYFTDQGQTGWQDPTGRVFRLRPSGELEKLIDTIPSPNGIALNAEQTQLYVGVTRANAVWRLQLVGGGVSNAGTWLQLSGGLSGPDGLAADAEGGLVVAHAGLCVWRFDRLGQPTHRIDTPFPTNVAFGGPENRSLFITESAQGCVMRAELPVAGLPLPGTGLAPLPGTGLAPLPGTGQAPPGTGQAPPGTGHAQPADRA